jgi:hypothetical protein
VTPPKEEEKPATEGTTPKEEEQSVAIEEQKESNE